MLRDSQRVTERVRGKEKDMQTHVHIERGEKTERVREKKRERLTDAFLLKM